MAVGLGAILLSLNTSLCWGFGNFFGGMLSKTRPAVSVVLWSQLMSTAVIVAVLLVATDGFSRTDIWVGLLAGLFTGIGLSVFYRAMAGGVTSVAAPIGGLSPVVPVMFSIMTGSVPHPVILAGIVIALPGIALTSMEKAGSEVRRYSAKQTAGLALVAMLAFGSVLTVLGAWPAASVSHALWITVWLRVGSMMVVGAAAAGKKRPRHTRSFLAAALLVGLVDFTAAASFAVAVRIGDLSVVSVLSALYPVVMILLALAVYRERIRALQYLGVAVTMTGILLISYGAGL